MFKPIIKWSGSKRSQCSKIVSMFPQKINTYYEPFVGGGSVLRELLDSKIKVNRYICSDINEDLISLWNGIKEYPDLLLMRYEKMHKELNRDGDLERKKNYFYSIRSKYNKFHEPADFLFIMRTTTNGMPRYNNNGEFNNSFHVTRNGIVPETLKKIMYDWNKKLNSYNVEFIHSSFENINSNVDDILYLDPPYFATKGMYYGKIDYDIFWKWLGEQQGNYYLSFDGKVKEENFTYDVPENLYSNHIYLNSDNSSFRRVIGNSKDSVVFESLYIK